MAEKKDLKNPSVAETLALAKADDILELDEVWSVVLKKKNKCWLWTAICRRTRQIVAYAIGDRSEATCQKLWEAQSGASNTFMAHLSSDQTRQN